jgi:hypothetical protein
MDKPDLYSPDNQQEVSMKRLITAVLACALAIGAAATAGDEVPWFDMEKCVFCKHFNDEPGCLDHATYEVHKIKNGIVSIGAVEPEWQEAWDRIEAAMKEEQKKIEAITDPAEMPYMCGSCCAYGEFMKAGLVPQKIESAVGDIEIWTSDDPAMVQKLHDFADKTMAAMAKMTEAAEAKE